MYIESKQEVRIILKHHYQIVNQPILRGKIVGRGDDYIDFHGVKDFPEIMIIPIDNILMIILKKKKAGD